MYGEKVEQSQELSLDLQEMKEMYKSQVRRHYKWLCKVKKSTKSEITGSFTRKKIIGKSSQNSPTLYTTTDILEYCTMCILFVQLYRGVQLLVIMI